jgi:two-component system chemotaxis response regulator CheB
LGAADYVAKPASDKLGGNELFRRELLEKVIALGHAKKTAPAAAGAPRPLARPQIPLRRAEMRLPRIIAIGSSTGGLQALLTLLGALPASLRCPIVIAQHMPATFTAVLADHLARASGRPASEAVDGMEIRRGTICVAPGDYHLQVVRENDRCLARLSQTQPENFCRPSVDPLFRSVAQYFGAESCAVVLTGMGSDGCAGARIMAAQGAPVIAQDEASSVVWGMPGAVAAAGICSAILPLTGIAPYLASLLEGASA